MVCLVSAAMIGATRIVCAITMACGVNKRPHDPSGPERDSDRNTASPTTTGGSPISALSTTITTSRPRKRLRAIPDERGEQDGAQTDDQRQPHDGKQRGVAREHQMEGGNVFRHCYAALFSE
jgi:hypothetical protein